ncbi:putative CRISPR-associated protein [Microcoleus sp. ZQ-A2]|nr:putative CRISPR-associated protein [Microcoleus sp. FACHB-1]
MPRLVISTVGTSILTNQLNLQYDSDWSKLLEERANDKEIDDKEDVLEAIEELTRRAKEKLYTDPEQKVINDDIDEIRSASAELNGIYGLYHAQLNQGNQDIHWLITTDTAQGQVSAELIRDFLRDNHVVVLDINTPTGLSTDSTENFTHGIDELLKSFDEIIPHYQQSGYQICFNLVGGFKALQGYVNTIGMFYQADEIIYIFEGSSKEKGVITIPRLPIQVDHSVIKPAQFSLMATDVGVWVKLSELQSVPETLIFVADDEATLSHWGRLTWNSCKRKFLTGDLLEFPGLVYEKSFIKDFARNKVNQQSRLDLHEVLAEVSGSMIKFNGDTTRFDTRLHFTRYEGGEKCEGGVRRNQIDHFYIKNTGWRVSCIAKDGKLYLRHYGEHDYVNDNP